MANNIHDTSMDSQLICNNHRFFHQCITQKVEKNHLLCPICQQMTHDQNQNSVTFLFEPFKLLLNDFIDQNRQLKQDVNQLKEQNQSQKQFFVEQLNQQSTEIKQLQDEINQLNKKSIEHANHINKLQTDSQNQNSHLLEVNQSHNLLKIKVKSIQKHINYPPQQLFIPNLNINQIWKQHGTPKAGDHGDGNRLNQLNHPFSVYIDDDQTIYVAETENHRIIEWKSDANNGQIVAGGNGGGNRNDQLNGPTMVIVDKENDSLIICDRENQRVVRWPRRNGQSGEILISNIYSYDLIMDNDGYLYVSDIKKHEVRRWKMGETNGTIVAGGNGKGSRLDQLNLPTYIFIDEDHSVYVSDCENHRVMKWVKGAKEGIVVAGGQGKGNGLKQLSSPGGIIVDQLDNIYVADFSNDRVVRWLKGAKEGTIVVGGNGKGKRANQLNKPVDLSFDQQNNLYVVDYWNHRVQKFDVDLDIRLWFS